MNKIKKLFSGMINAVKQAFNMFPLTIMIVYVLTLIATFLIIGTDFSETVEEMIAHVWIVGVITAFGSWLSEALFEKKDLKRLIGYALSLAIAFSFDRILDGELFEENVIARWLGEYVILCFFSTVYVLIKKSGEKLERYALNVLYNLKRAGIIYGIVAIGFLFLYLIFTVLILDDVDFEIYIKILVMFTGFYLVPVGLKAFANEEAEDTKFNKTVFTKVLLPLIFLAMLIVYIYIVKILVITEMPKNQLFMILSMIFASAFPVYIINKNYGEEGSLLEKVNKSIPYLFTPFIFLQIYTMGIRIKEYGLTESRYMAIVLIVFEIIAIALSVCKNSKYLRELVLAGMVISVVVMISPFNFEKAPLKSQKKIVDSYVEQNVDFEKLNDYDKRRFAGAYQYIKNDEEFINSQLSLEEKEVLSSYNTYRYSYGETKDYEEDKDIYIGYTKPFDNIDITGYKKIYKVPYVNNQGGTAIIYDRFKDNESYTYSLENYEYDLEFSVDIATYVSKILEAYEISNATAERIFKEELSTVLIGDNRELYITEISIHYHTDTKVIDSVGIEGFMLEK